MVLAVIEAATQLAVMHMRIASEHQGKTRSRCEKLGWQAKGVKIHASGIGGNEPEAAPANVMGLIRSVAL